MCFGFTQKNPANVPPPARPVRDIPPNRSETKSPRISVPIFPTTSHDSPSSSEPRPSQAQSYEPQALSPPPVHHMTRPAPISTTTHAELDFQPPPGPPPGPPPIIVTGQFISDHSSTEGTDQPKSTPVSTQEDDGQPSQDPDQVPHIPWSLEISPVQEDLPWNGTDEVARTRISMPLQVAERSGEMAVSVEVEDHLDGSSMRATYTDYSGETAVSAPYSYHPRGSSSVFVQDTGQPEGTTVSTQTAIRSSDGGPFVSTRHANNPIETFVKAQHVEHSNIPLVFVEDTDCTVEPFVFVPNRHHIEASVPTQHTSLSAGATPDGSSCDNTEHNPLSYTCSADENHFTQTHNGDIDAVIAAGAPVKQPEVDPEHADDEPTCRDSVCVVAEEYWQIHGEPDPTLIPFNVLQAQAFTDPAIMLPINMSPLWPIQPLTFTNDSGSFVAPNSDPPRNSTLPDAPPPAPVANLPAPQPWEVVPDTAMFPPPPPYILQHEFSFTSNASRQDFLAAQGWCIANPLLTGPTARDDDVLAAFSSRNFSLQPPAAVVAEYRRAIEMQVPLTSISHAQSPRHAVWEISTIKDQRDATWVLTPPVYSASLMEKDMQAGTIYYEVKILNSIADHAAIAIGFSALPYPDFRLPGWHRGSLAVHGDDGRRYIADSTGGIDFVEPFEKGDVVGIGMRFERYPNNNLSAYKVTCFFTRNGVREGLWDLHEEVDGETTITLGGLKGAHDLFMTVGTNEDVHCQIMLESSEWFFNPYKINL